MVGLQIQSCLNIRRLYIMNKQLTPLMRGRLSHLIDSPLTSFIDEFFGSSLPMSLIERQESYPKYNIIRANADTTDQFTIQLAVAGFDKDEITVYTDSNDVLYVEASTPNTPEVDYLFKGISTRPFKWSLRLPQYSKISSTTLSKGLLLIDVEIVVPKEEQPIYYKIKEFK